jgi:adenylate cyclase class IV
LRQDDTYFNVPQGRLKLRREAGAAAHLIAYERPDLRGQKESRYRIVEIGDASGIEEALAGVLGITAVVSKARRLFLFDGVRIHLDRVDGLGSFIEFEGVAAPGDVDFARLEVLLADLRNSFSIEDTDLLGGSYCDLVLAAAQR